MDKILEIISQLYSKDGYKFEQEVTIPILNRKIKATIVIDAKSPTKFTFTSDGVGGILKFEPGVKIHIPMVFIDTTLIQIEFDKETATIHATGCPAIHIPLKKV